MGGCTRSGNNSSRRPSFSKSSIERNGDDFAVHIRRFVRQLIMAISEVPPRARLRFEVSSGSGYGEPEESTRPSIWQRNSGIAGTISEVVASVRSIEQGAQIFPHQKRDRPDVQSTADGEVRGKGRLCCKINITSREMFDCTCNLKHLPSSPACLSCDAQRGFYTIIV